MVVFTVLYADIHFIHAIVPVVISMRDTVIYTNRIKSAQNSRIAYPPNITIDNIQIVFEYLE